VQCINCFAKFYTSYLTLFCFSYLNEVKDLKVVFVGKEHMTTEHIWAPVALKFQNDGWEVIYCTDGSTLGDIGFYCEDRSLPGNQRFTIITINGLDQDHVARPEYTQWFENENWGLFDLGLLPGQRWYTGWLTRKPSFLNTPTHGVINIGWFKGDFAAKNYARPLHKKTIRSILYAPQTEQDGKQRQVVDSIKKTNLNLIIKHWEDDDYLPIFPWLLTPAYMENLASENQYAMQHENVTVVSPRENFMNVLKDVDLLITDQSSVLYEAALLNIPSLTCVDWKHACGDCRGPQPSPEITDAIKSDDLPAYMQNIEVIYPKLLDKVLHVKEFNFIHVGYATEVMYKQILNIHELLYNSKSVTKLYKRRFAKMKAFRKAFKQRKRAMEKALHRKVKAVLKV